jgi:signal peptidase I
MGAQDVTGERERAVPHQEAERTTTHRGETLRAFLLAVAVALGIRAFVVEPFKIPSGSMIPTLLIGDYILVNKFAYGVRMPFTGSVLIPFGKPTRGDVVVFRFPDDPSIDYIKRVMGVPGDRIETKGDRVWVNGELLDRIPQSDFLVHDYETGRTEAAHRYTERNIEGDEYTIIHSMGRGSGPEQSWEVPPDSYFMMGDNRDNSKDSRRWLDHFVSEDQLKGRAFMVHWSWVVGNGRSDNSNFFADFVDTLLKVVTLDIEEIRWDRIGRQIDGTAAD